MKSLAVKYRPKTWEDVVEQEAIVMILQEQVLTNSQKHSYLFVGPAGCGKTTSARIFANALNQDKGSPIEIDAASNSGVENVRGIVEDAKRKPIAGAYKIYIVDECFRGDSEILTLGGWKRFDELDKNDKVAQYTDEGNIEFVYPSRYIEKPYEGEIIKFEPRKGHSIYMTPRHQQPLVSSVNGAVKTTEIKQAIFNQNWNLLVAGQGVGKDFELSAIQRLAIACQADGSIVYSRDGRTKWDIRLKKPEKIERILSLFKEAAIEYKQIPCKDGTTRYLYFTPSSITKKLTTTFDLNMSFFSARSFLQEVMQWDGSYKSGYDFYYSSIIKENVDFVSAVGTLAGCSCKQGKTLPKKDTHSVLYHVQMYERMTRPSTYCKRTSEYFEGTVYCVEVPSHKIVVRAEGFTFISGNCHSLSNGAWQAFLKLLEEPPATAVFIFCTTDPQKIPATILSRVQRYDFSRMSLEGLKGRCLKVLKEEGYKII